MAREPGNRYAIPDADSQRITEHDTNTYPNSYSHSFPVAKSVIYALWSGFSRWNKGNYDYRRLRWCVDARDEQGNFAKRCAHGRWIWTGLQVAEWDCLRPRNPGAVVSMGGRFVGWCWGDRAGDACADTFADSHTIARCVSYAERNSHSYSNPYADPLYDDSQQPSSRSMEHW